jgi:hypothetical protein
MKLNTAHAMRAAEQLNATMLADTNPAIEVLEERFGDHTFFIDFDGLFIVEDESDAGVKLGRVVKLARWAASDHTILEPLPRERTDVIVPLTDAA